MKPEDLIGQAATPSKCMSLRGLDTKSTMLLPCDNLTRGRISRIGTVLGAGLGAGRVCSLANVLANL